MVVGNRIKEATVLSIVGEFAKRPKIALSLESASIKIRIMYS